MRFFRKKSDPSGHQEYLDGLITSIRQARRDEEEKPGLHAFVEDDEYLPGGRPDAASRVPPGVADPGPAAVPPESAEAEAVASLEAYLSALNAADAAQTAEEEDEDRGEDAI
jgi:hypothetical protein